MPKKIRSEKCDINFHTFRIVKSVFHIVNLIVTTIENISAKYIKQYIIHENSRTHNLS